LNAAAGVSISIYYDYVDDCADARNRECRFGIVRQQPVADGRAAVVHAPKPAYHAAATLQKWLGSATVTQRLQPLTGSTAAASLFVLLFQNGVLAGWTNISETATVTVRPPARRLSAGTTLPPPTPRCWRVIMLDGSEAANRLCPSAPNGELTVSLSQSAIYLVPLAP
jgi:hypothetical protein